jgi:leucyl aminopeptidase
MTPDTLALEAARLADDYQAKIEVTLGDELLNAGFRTIHAVGRAAAVAPRLIDLTWGDSAHPRITIIGKGVCFDSGGLNLKPAASMRNMKKDMGGAAQALGLAQMIMATGLPIRLRVLIAAVENAVAGNAYRPGDIIKTYKGLTVEIDNTDAEGRLVMCDALALAAEEKPELIIDFSTLTGSARSALGPEVGAMFSNNDEVAQGLASAGADNDDDVWRLPLHQPYRAMIDSKVADMVNSASSPMAGAITAALFLEPFVDGCNWAHFDIHAFNVRPRPARPEGGEATGARAVFGYLQNRYGG